MKSRTTYELDARSVRVLKRLARRWGVSESEALGRAIRSEGCRQMRNEDAIAALQELQASLRRKGVDVARWEREAREERRASWGPGRASPGPPT